MKLLIYFQVLLITLFSCNRKISAGPSTITAGSSTGEPTTSAPSIPACIKQKIDSIKQQPAWNPPARVEEYEYEGRKVYLLSANCCDRFTTAFDGTCNYICAPSGGFTGRGDGKCRDFSEKAKMIRLVWKDERQTK